MASQCLDWITAVLTWLPFFLLFFFSSTMTSLFFPFSPQLNIVQLYQEECVMVLLLAGNFPVHTASVAPVQNNLMVFMRRSCKHKLKPLHATSINALLLFLLSNLQGTLVMDHSVSYGWIFRRKGSSVQQIELIQFCVRDLVIYLLLRYYSYQTSWNSGGRKYNLWCAGVWVLLFASCSMRERQTPVKLKAALFMLVMWSRFTYFQLEFGAYSQNVTEVKNWQDAKGDIYVAYDKTVVVRVRIKNTRASQNRWRSASCQITVSFWLMGVREKLPQGEILEQLSPRFLVAFSQLL